MKTTPPPVPVPDSTGTRSEKTRCGRRLTWDDPTLTGGIESRCLSPFPASERSMRTRPKVMIVVALLLAGATFLALLPGRSLAG